MSTDIPECTCSEDRNGGDPSNHTASCEWANAVEARERMTEYAVTLHATNGEFVGCGLSLHQCPTCWALVVEDFMPEHLAWHREASGEV